MRPLSITMMLLCAASATAQDAAITPTEELRTSVREWVATMQKIQTEENDWLRDQEVLANYKEGLQKEIDELKERIAEAQTRKDGADQESLDRAQERDRLAAAKDQLAVMVRGVEEELAEKLPLLPEPLLKDARLAQSVDDLRRDLALPEDRRSENVSKRLLNAISLTTEAEKFQQAVHLRSELHTDGSGREFNMKAIYFGLAAAYAVNEDGTHAIAGLPTFGGWKFVERKDLAPAITQLIAATTGDADAAFIQLPVSKP